MCRIVPNCFCSECATCVDVVASLQGRMVINSGKHEAEWKRLDLNGDGTVCNCSQLVGASLPCLISCSLEHYTIQRS